MFFQNGWITKAVAVLTLISFVVYGSSCTFYQARKLDTGAQLNVSSVKRYSPDRFTFVIHLGEEMVQLTNVVLDSGNDVVTGTRSQMDYNILAAYYGIEVGRTKRFKGRNLYARQVHLFVTEFSDNGNGQLSINGKDVEKTVIYNINGLPTTLSFIAVAGLTFVAAVWIFIAIACNCPHVYTFDGVTYNFNATLFTGAVTPGLERNDYKTLPDYFPDSEAYKLKVINEELELQHTNLLELMVVPHSKGSMVSTDHQGNVYEIHQPIAPLSAHAGSINVLPEVGEMDDLMFDFSEPGENDFSDLILTFPQQNKMSQANLFLRLKNAAWGGFVYKDFISKFGYKYRDWAEKNQEKPDMEATEWARSQGIPLAVEVKRGDEWEIAEYIELVGEVDFNSVVVPLDLSGLGDEELQVRLRSGYKFWEIDYAAMDYNNQVITDYAVVKPSQAIGNSGEDFVAALSYDDDSYMHHLEKGDFSEVTFMAPVAADTLDRTLILHSKGYYQSNYTYEGKMQWAKLLKYKRPGELSRQSRELFEAFQQAVTLTRN